MVDGFGEYPNVYMSFKVVMIVTQLCTVEALQKAKRYIVREDAMLCCFGAQCNARWAARACNIIHYKCRWRAVNA